MLTEDQVLAENEMIIILETEKPVDVRYFAMFLFDLQIAADELLFEGEGRLQVSRVEAGSILLTIAAVVGIGGGLASMGAFALALKDRWQKQPPPGVLHITKDGVVGFIFITAEDGKVFVPASSLQPMEDDTRESNDEEEGSLIVEGTIIDGPGSDILLFRSKNGLEFSARVLNSEKIIKNVLVQVRARLVQSTKELVISRIIRLD